MAGPLPTRKHPVRSKQRCNLWCQECNTPHHRELAGIRFREIVVPHPLWALRRLLWPLRRPSCGHEHDCHAERSLSAAKRNSGGVEAPLPWNHCRRHRSGLTLALATRRALAIALLCLSPTRSHLCSDGRLFARRQYLSGNRKHEFVLDANVLFID